MAAMMAPVREKQMVHTSSSELSLKKVSLYLERFRGKKSELFLFRFIDSMTLFATIKV